MTPPRVTGRAGGAEEREVKLAVPDDFVLSGLSDLGGVVVVDRGDMRLLDVYWDSDDLALCRAGVGLRHRNGIWAYKGTSRRDGDAVVREEVELPADGEDIPPDMRGRVRQWVDVTTLHPVAELDTLRHQVDVVDAPQRAEVVHDCVRISDGDRVVSSFGEVEVEFERDSKALADRVVSVLVGRGAVVESTSKYLRALRALGHDPPEVWT